MGPSVAWLCLPLWGHPTIARIGLRLLTIGGRSTLSRLAVHGRLAWLRVPIGRRGVRTPRNARGRLRVVGPRLHLWLSRGVGGERRLLRLHVLKRGHRLLSSRSLLELGLRDDGGLGGEEREGLG